MSREQFTNNPSTTLSADVTDTDTTWPVTSSSGFPTGGQFRALCGSEIVLVTAVSGTNWTVTRGAEGTTAASHTSGDTVVHPLTTAALLNLVVQSHGGTLVGSRRELNFIDTATVTWTLTDDGTNNKMDIEADSAGGSGGGSPGERALTAPVLTDFTTDVSAVSGATIAQFTGGIQINSPTATADASLIAYKSAPATPYSVIAKLRLNAFATNYTSAGIMVRESSSGKMVRINHAMANKQISVDKYTNNTTFSAEYTHADEASGCVFSWFKINDDGTNLKFSVSSDGNNWLLVKSVSRTDFMTPDQVGFTLNPNASTFGFTSGLAVISWEEV